MHTEMLLSTVARMVVNLGSTPYIVIGIADSLWNMLSCFGSLLRGGAIRYQRQYW